VVTGFGTYPQRSGAIEDIALAPDGRVAIVSKGGGEKPVEVAMLGADGSLDRSFSGDGLIQPQLETSRPLSGISVQIAFAGKALLLAGYAGPPDASGVVKKYRPDGRLDHSFGSPVPHGHGRRSGIAELDSGAHELLVQPGGEILLFSGATATRLDPRGKVLHSSSTAGAGEIGVVAMNPQGSFIASAGNDEEPFFSSLLHYSPAARVIHRADFGESPPYVPSRIALAPDGSVLAVSLDEDGVIRALGDDRTPDPAFHGDSPPCRAAEASSAKPSFARIFSLPDGRIVLTGSCGVVRLLADASPDPSFASGGLLGLAVETRQVAVAADGAVVYAGWDTARGPEVTRITPSGEIDPGFGTAGHATISLRTPISAQANALARVPGGGVIAAGRAERRAATGCSGLALARYRADGRLDRGFGERGRVLSEREGFGSASAVAVARSGEVIVAGQTNLQEESGDKPFEPAFAIAKLGPTGSFDRRFGGNGVLVDQISPGHRQRSEIAAMALQPNGRILVAGISQGCPKVDVCYTLARYLANGSRDRSFSGDGILSLAEGGATPKAIALAPNGEIVVTGGGYGRAVTIRLTPRGRLDPAFGRQGVVDRPVRYRYRQGEREVIDLGLAPEAVLLGRDGSVLVGGGNGTSRGFLERYRRDGGLDRSLGRGGRLALNGFGLSAVEASRCGLLLAGATVAKEGLPRMSVLAIPESGRGHRKLLRPFGALHASFGKALVLGGQGRGFIAGSLLRYAGSSEFALAGFDFRSLSGC
jgi:uncharacterized delta-60 repeat protein